MSDRALLLALYAFLQKEYGGRVAPYDISHSSQEALLHLLKLLAKRLQEERNLTDFIIDVECKGCGVEMDVVCDGYVAHITPKCDCPYGLPKVKAPECQHAWGDARLGGWDCGPGGLHCVKCGAISI